MVNAVLSRLSSALKSSWLLIAVFVFTLALETYNLILPSYWGDETSAISASTRSLSELWLLVHHVDVVHGFYYLSMHFWLGLVGVSQLSVRLPSAVAVALAATLLFAVLRKRTGFVSALAATAAFSLMPRVFWAAGIGRSYAFSILFGMLLTWLLIQVIEAKQPKKRVYWLYGLVAILASLTFVYSVLMVACQLLALILLRVGWSKIWRLGLASAAVFAVSAPLALWAKSQSFQILWMGDVSTDALDRIFGSVLFYSVPQVTWLTWGLISFGLLATLIAKHKPFAKLVLPSLLVALLPPTLVYLYSLGNQSIFNGRYFSFSAGAVAILIAVGVQRMRFNGLQLLAGIALVGVSLAPSLSWRDEDRFGNDQNKLAAVVAAEATAGDGFLVAPSGPACTAACRVIDGFAPQLAKLKVLGLRGEKNRLGLLKDRYLSMPEILKQTSQVSRLWLVQNIDGKPGFEKPLVDGLAQQGFSKVKTLQLKYETLGLLTK